MTRFSPQPPAAACVYREGCCFWVVWPFVLASEVHSERRGLAKRIFRWHAAFMCIENANRGNLAFDPITLRYYADIAPTYVGSGSNRQNRYLAHFLSRIAPGSRILDLGCGGGIDARAMLDRGHLVDAAEGSQSLAAIASKRLDREVAVMRFDELRSIETYDAVWASASLIHVPRPALSAVLSKIHTALKPGGLHFATYKAGGKDGRDSVGRYYNYPTAAELRTFYLDSARWNIIAIDEYVGGGFEGGNGPWAAIEARRSTG